MKLQRRQKIEEYVKKYGSVSLDDLCQQFAVSRNTIRRDLHELEARHVIKKVYGGVILANGDTPIPLSQRQMTMQAEKAIIAEKAATFVKDGDIVVIDAGSTTARIVEYLKNKRNLTIITNSVPVLTAALAYEQLQVIVTGGDLLRSTNSLVGMEALTTLKKLNANIGFLAATGVSLTKGITNSSTMELEIKRMMIEVSERIMLLVDHSKFDTVSLVAVADLQDIDIIVTDATPPASYVQYCAEHDVKIIIANP